MNDFYRGYEWAFDSVVRSVFWKEYGDEFFDYPSFDELVSEAVFSSISGLVPDKKESVAFILGTKFFALKFKTRLKLLETMNSIKDTNF